MKPKKEVKRAGLWMLLPELLVAAGGVLAGSVLYWLDWRFTGGAVMGVPVGWCAAWYAALWRHRAA